MNRITTLVLLLSSFSLQAQCEEQIKSKLQEVLAFKVEYFGELVLHPGLSAGVEYTIAESKKISIHWNTDLGGYSHRWNNNAVFLKTSIGSRFMLGSAFTDLNLGIGYMHSWADGMVYQRAETGKVEEANNWGHPHFMPNASLLFGWDLGRKTNLPVMIHFGPEVYLQSSFNHIFLPHLAMKFGFTYKFNQL